MQKLHTILNAIGYTGNKNFKSPRNPVSDSKGQKKNYGHYSEKYRHAPDRMGHPLVNLFCPRFLLSLIHKDFVDNFFNKVILLVDNFMFIILINDIFCMYRIVLHDFRVFFKYFNCMPSRIDNIRKLSQQPLFQVVNLILDIIRIHHRKLFVVIVTMDTLTHQIVMMFHWHAVTFSLVMGHSMHQYLKTCPFSRRNRHDRDPQHFR